MDNVIQFAVSQARNKGIDSIRFSEFFFSFICPSAEKFKEEDIPYLGCMDKLEAMGHTVSNDACIWRVTFN